jgi:hypothetical protein
MHVFLPVEGSGKVKVFQVEAHVFPLLCAEDTVPMEFDVVISTVHVVNIPG